MRTIPAILDSRLCQEVHSLSSDKDDFQTYIGGTMCADDFYRGTFNKTLNINKESAICILNGTYTYTSYSVGVCTSLTIKLIGLVGIMFVT